MFKFLFKLFLFIDFLFLNLVAISFFLPANYQVKREIVIDSTPEQIYQYVGTLKSWKDWSYWNNSKEKFKDLKYSYSGPESGVGSVSQWTDPANGNGRMEIIAADPQKGIDTEIQFDGFEGKMYGSIQFVQQGDSTKVIWTAAGKNGVNPIARYMGYGLDYLLGPQYEEGLSNLKAKVEADSSHDSAENSQTEPRSTVEE